MSKVRCRLLHDSMLCPAPVQLQPICYRWAYCCSLRFRVVQATDYGFILDFTFSRLAKNQDETPSPSDPKSYNTHSPVMVLGPRNTDVNYLGYKSFQNCILHTIHLDLEDSCNSVGNRMNPWSPKDYLAVKYCLKISTTLFSSERQKYYDRVIEVGNLVPCSTDDELQ